MAYWHDKKTGHPARPFSKDAYFDWSHLVPAVPFLILIVYILIRR